MFWVLIVSRVAPSGSINSFLSLLQNTWYPFANEHQPSTPLHDFLMVLQIYVRPDNIILVLGILGWAFLLSRISGYRKWGWILAAGMAGVFLGKAPIDRLDGWIQQSPPLYGWPVHVRFAVFLSFKRFVCCDGHGTDNQPALAELESQPPAYDREWSGLCDRRDRY